MRRRSMLMMLWLLVLLCCAGCGDDDDDDTADDDTADDDTADDDTADDDAADDDTADDDTADDDTVPEDPLAFVDPLIGTGGFIYGYASAYPGPKAPFGMVSAGPDTTMHGITISNQHFSGYYYPDTYIRGFSHTRMHGTGAADLCNVMIMPLNGMPGRPIKESRYWSSFSHANETSLPGYYSVLLDDSGVFAELTTTELAALHRYSYPDEGKPYVVVNPSHSVEAGWVTNATVHIVPATNSVHGMVEQHGPMTGRFGGVVVYYAMQFSQPFTGYGTWKDGTPTANREDEEGADIGAYLAFAENLGDPLLVKVGLSYQSEEQAAANLAAQIPAWDFEGTVLAVRDQWSEKLGQIEVRGGTDRQKRIFYSALYHVYMMPTDYTEENNKYIGFDLALHDAGTRRYYSDFSLWDTFRTEHPLLNLLQPTISADMMQSLTLMYLQGGGVPRWPLITGDTGSMIGTSADIVFGEAYLKGIRDWDYDAAYEGCYAHATGPVAKGSRGGIEEYLTLGWVPEDLHSRGTCDTLEYAYDDAALSKWAAAMGLDEDAAMFAAHSQNYRNHFDADTGYMRPRNSDGSWFEPLKPYNVFSEQYVEGNSWHWTFYVPHDAEGLIDLFGGDEDFVEVLDYAFQQAVHGPDNAWLPDVFYWFGNEMSMFHAYLFAYAGRPDLTQKYVRWILESKFDDTPGGLDGNDDAGTLSSWYIMSSLGFFALAGTDQYVIGSPLFDGATLHLPGGDLVITVENNGPENVYVASVKLNGTEMTEPFFTHDQIVNGGTLEFIMSPFPSKWGSGD